jgi:hypothetical protein
MKKHTLSAEKMFSQKVIKANQTSFDNVRQYQKAIETIEKIHFPFGKEVVYRQVGASTTNLSINTYGNITTG